MIKCLPMKGVSIALVVFFTVRTINAEESTVPLRDIYTIIENLVGPIVKSVKIQVSEDDANDVKHPIILNDVELKDDAMQNDTNDINIETPLPRYSEETVLNDIVNNLEDSVVIKNINDEIERKRKKDARVKEALTEESEETIILNIPSSNEIKSNRRNMESNPQPKRKTQDDYAKYKQLQRKIGSLLNKEQISDKTKGLISDAFDRVITQMNGKCVWRATEDEPNMNRRLGKHQKAAMKTMLKLYKSQFNKLIDMFRKSEDKSEIFGSEQENSKFLANLRELFFEMHNSFQNFTRRQPLHCDVVNVGKHKNTKKQKITTTVQPNILREKNTQCKFKSICPYELKKFLSDLSKHLYKTVYLIFNNYRDMYKADVSKETRSDQKMFFRFIEEAKNRVNNKFNETLFTEIDNINLDTTHDINVKVERIRKFIYATVNHIKRLINDVVKDELSKLPIKIQDTVKSDFTVNTDVELVNVQDKFEAKMCKAFETCYSTERRKGSRKSYKRVLLTQ